jgi:hypothetical protein
MRVADKLILIFLGLRMSGDGLVVVRNPGSRTQLVDLIASVTPVSQKTRYGRKHIAKTASHGADYRSCDGQGPLFFAGRLCLPKDASINRMLQAEVREL